MQNNNQTPTNSNRRPRVVYREYRIPIRNTHPRPNMLPLEFPSTIQLSIFRPANRSGPQNHTQTQIIIPIQSFASPSNQVSRIDQLVPHEDLFGSSLLESSLNEHYRQGASFFKQKDFHNAYKCFDRAFQQDPKSVYLANKALCLKKVNAIEESICCIKEAIRLDPTDKYFRFQGHLQFTLGKVTNSFEYILDSLESFREAHEVNSVYDNRHNYLQLRKVVFFERVKKQQTEYKELVDYLNSNRQNPTRKKTKKVKNQVIASGLAYLRDPTSYSNNSGIPQFCVGVIGMEPLRVPVVTVSGNSFEKSLLEEHCRVSGCSDPITREKFQSMEKVYSNRHLERVILSMYLKKPWLFDSDLRFEENTTVWKFAELV